MNLYTRGTAVVSPRADPGFRPPSAAGSPPPAAPRPFRRWSNRYRAGTRPLVPAGELAARG